MSGVVLGEVLRVIRCLVTGAWTRRDDGIHPGWYTFVTDGQPAYVRIDGSSDLPGAVTDSGVMFIERGAARSFYISGRRIDYYQATGGVLRVELVKPRNPYGG